MLMAARDAFNGGRLQVGRQNQRHPSLSTNTRPAIIC